MQEFNCFLSGGKSRLFPILWDSRSDKKNWLIMMILRRIVFVIFGEFHHKWHDSILDESLSFLKLTFWSRQTNLDGRTCNYSPSEDYSGQHWVQSPWLASFSSPQLWSPSTLTYGWGKYVRSLRFPQWKGKMGPERRGFHIVLLFWGVIHV